MSKEKPILLGDYVNEYENILSIIHCNREAAGLSSAEIFELSTVSRQEIRAALAVRKIRTVAERYAPGSDQAYRPEDADLIQEITSQPEKIGRLHELAVSANACENTQIYRRSYNDAMNIIFGESRKPKF
ncbi:MAG: hypothetical protein QOG91_201 [Candidatus Parcubacteria bacterium]|jgi:hypothetical protein|nr:hypothetical protein [Candidatus Parcubacteria bacterium]